MTYTDPLMRWFEQAGQQHDHNHYLDWLGGKEITCTSSTVSDRVAGRGSAPYSVTCILSGRG